MFVWVGVCDEIAGAGRARGLEKQFGCQASGIEIEGSDVWFGTWWE